MENLHTACFTGHRTNSFRILDPDLDMIVPLVRDYLGQVIHLLYSRGVTRFISGGALGVDQWAAEEVLLLKEQHPDVVLTIAKPFPSQDLVWSEDQSRYYRELCSRADEVIEVSPDPYAPWKMHCRNAWMVDNSNILIAVKFQDVYHGGTASCCAYAERKHKPIIYINPKSGIISTFNYDLEE